jgi:hypothetical protein
VINLAKEGDHYWVFAHVTPSFGSNGSIIGYHSNRRAPERSAIKSIEEIYQILVAEESRHTDARKGLLASYELLGNILEKQNVKYDEFIFSL